MKKALVSLTTVSAVMMLLSTPVMANVVRPEGQTTGKPVAAYSNPGSAQGQANRSATGTYNKTTHDGAVPVWD